MSVVYFNLRTYLPPCPKWARSNDMSAVSLNKSYAEYVTAIHHYIEEARAHHENIELPAPEPTLLTNGLEKWLKGIVSADVIQGGHAPDYIAITF